MIERLSVLASKRISRNLIGCDLIKLSLRLSLTEQIHNRSTILSHFPPFMIWNTGPPIGTCDSLNPFYFILFCIQNLCLRGSDRINIRASVGSCLMCLNDEGNERSDVIRVRPSRIEVTTKDVWRWRQPGMTCCGRPHHHGHWVSGMHSPAVTNTNPSTCKGHFVGLGCACQISAHDFFLSASLRSSTELPRQHKMLIFVFLTTRDNWWMMISHWFAGRPEREIALDSKRGYHRLIDRLNGILNSPIVDLWRGDLGNKDVSDIIYTCLPVDGMDLNATGCRKSEMQSIDCVCDTFVGDKRCELNVDCDASCALCIRLS